MPFDVPKGWVWTILGEIAESNIGLTYKPSDICNDGVPVYRSNNIQGVKIDTTDLVRVQTTILDKQFLKEGDLLICARNGSRRLVGKNAIIRKLTEKTAFGAFMAVCRSKYNPWLHLLLQTSYFDKYLDESNSTAINQVTQSMLLALNTPLPPLAEQQRIVAEIERWFALIDIIEQGKVNLQTAIKQMKSKILDLAIHGKLVPQDASDEPASELLKRINPKAQKPCDNGHYAQLPKGWSICELMDVAKIVTGSTPSKSNLSYYGGNFPLYKPSDLDAGRHTNTASEYLTTKGRDVSRIIPPNSIAICCIGSIGKVGYIEQEGTTNQQINTAIPSLAIFPDYLYHLCTSTYFQNSLMEKSSAVTISIVNKSKMEHIKIPLPPKEEQARIIVAIDNLFNALDAVKENL